MARPEKRRRITAASIPDDLLISEVLVRLPAKSLARFKSVCRSWRAGIADAAFVRRHLELSRARPPSVLAIPREVDPDEYQATTGEISFHRLMPPGQAPGNTEAELIFEKAWPEGITRLIFSAHCDGLVAIATATDRVFVCNPATREFVALPLGSHNAELDHSELLVPPVALGFDRWRNSYVVARYFYRIYGDIYFDEVTGEYFQVYNIGHEVFTLGGDSWELTQGPPHAVGIQRPICTRRAFYWHAYEPQPRLMRFSLQNRTFDVVSRPPAGWNPLDDMTDLDGKLCYVHAAAEASFQVWLADDGPKQLQWSLRCRIDLLDPVPNLNYNLTPVIADGDEMLVFVGNSKLLRYNVPNKALEEVADVEHELGFERPDGTKYIDSIGYALPYLESLVSPSTCNY